MSQRPSIRSS